MSLKKQYFKSDPKKNVCKVTFRMSRNEVQGADEVNLVGDFNDWDINATPMKKLKNGDFSITLELEVGKVYQYRYFLDHERWENDWDADEYVQSYIGDVDNSVVIV